MSTFNPIFTPQDKALVQGLSNGNIDVQTVEALTVTADEIILNANTSPPFNSVYISYGAGSPEGVIPAGQGSIYLRTDGATNTTLYVKTAAGTAPNYTDGWTAK